MSKQKNKKRFVRYFPMFGSMATGLIYMGVGVVAILSFLQIKEGGADESSLLAFLNDYLVGKILVWLVLLGTLSFIGWRIFEAIRDPYNYGSDIRGIGRRMGIGLSSIADMLMAYSAIMVLLGISGSQESGDPEEEREMVGSMLQESWGDWLIIAMGIIIAITALVQFYYGVTRGYRERLDIIQFGKKTRSTIHFLAYVGYFARGTIIGIIGFFFIKAGISDNPDFVVNTDKAFDFIGDHVGGLPFILVALGTICYALFMFFMGITYDTDNNEDSPKNKPA